MHIQQLFAWGIFLALVLLILAMDLLVLHRKPHEIHLREAALGSMLPVGLALLFTAAIFWAYNSHAFNLGQIPAHAHRSAQRYYPATGHEAAVYFFTGYVVELSLSADNIFLFIILMNFFKVSREHQHRVLFWGVLGALLMRGVMILLGAALLERFQWIIYVFGAFLLYAAAKMFFSGGQPKDPSDNWAIRGIRGVIPFHPDFDGQRFFTRINGTLMGTSLLLVLICIEFTDLVFALDSIPAVFGITRDPFIVFTSNVFAILGLRSMYFLLAGVMDKFHFLKIGLAGVLAFVGVKMILPGLGELYERIAGGEHHWEIDKYVSLGIIVAALGLSVLASLAFPAKLHTHNPLQNPENGRTRQGA